MEAAADKAHTARARGQQQAEWAARRVDVPATLAELDAVRGALAAAEQRCQEAEGRARTAAQQACAQGTLPHGMLAVHMVSWSHVSPSNASLAYSEKSSCVHLFVGSQEHGIGNDQANAC